MRPVSHSSITVYPLLHQGKVRDVYAVDDATLLIVTTDRLSAFDVVMGETIPYKGVILNGITLFWMERLRGIIPNHLLESDVQRFPAALDPWKDALEGRAVLVRRARPLPVECIVRGYLAGSGWKEYQATGSVGGHALPAGLGNAARLETPLFTPSTKAAPGQHDENIDGAALEGLIGAENARQAREASLRLYAAGSAHAADRGILIADTKFEFGHVDGRLTLIDEVMTPDSSRFWPAADYAPGRQQPSFDKQCLRDWLEAQPWDKQPPPPPLPAAIVAMTAAKYREAHALLTGKHVDTP